MTTVKQQLAKLTEIQRRRFEDGRCLKCGSPITTQDYIGSLCRKCNKDYFDFQNVELEKTYDKNPKVEVFLPVVQDELLFKFLRGERFVFR
jgi:hypothetical protein